MKLLKLYIQLIMVTISSTSHLFGQVSKVPIKFWDLQSIDGVIGFEGEYKTQDIELRSNYSDNLKSSKMVGKLGLNTQSYFYHPNLISLDTEMEYNPGTSKDKYLIIPDRADVSTGERARGLITFMRTQPVIVTGNANFAHHYTSRENTTNIETYNTGFGGGLRYRNDFAPISISYRKENIDQRELQTDREYLTKRENIRANSELSLGDFDKTRLSYTFDNYDRQYYSSLKTRSKVSSLQLNSNVYLDSTKINTLNSNISYSLNSGDFESNRLQINESLNLQLQSNFLYNGNYSFFNFDQQQTKSAQHIINNRLEHQLYKSLRTHISYEYVNSNQTFYEEIIGTAGIGISYNKKVPTGNLSLSYNFRKRNLENNNLSPDISIINEEHSLNDDEIILLNNPYVEISSILVKDITGSIIYQEFLDYILIERGEFIEVQRIPGGLFSDGSSIYVDYQAIGQPSYEYAVNTNNFTSRLSLFNNFFEIYFRLNENYYDNIIGRDATILKTRSQRVYGSKIRFNLLSAGIEFDDYNSNIIPYESTRYYLTLSSRISDNFSTSVTGNLKFIELINENEKQEFRDLAGRLIYNVSKITSFSLEASYRFQRGKGLDLDLSIIRAELKTQYRAIYLTFGIEGYNRKYISEKLNYLGSFIRIERKF
jgi:hypothetical protein